MSIARPPRSRADRLHEQVAGTGTRAAATPGAGFPSGAGRGYAVDLTGHPGAQGDAPSRPATDRLAAA